jgi:hypothetical protein
MKEQTPEEKLELIEAALNHFYDIDTETLLGSYLDHLDKKAEAATPPAPVDRETAIAYFQVIPEKCNSNQSLEMKTEMLGALSEAEFQALCEEQVKAHPKIAMDIRSMFDFCLKFKRML